jgi:signal peptidase II
MQAQGGARLIEELAPPEPAPRAGSVQWAGMLSVAVAAIVADQLTKRLIEHQLALNQSHHVLPFIAITHVRNTGIAFGIFPGRLGIVSVLTVVAVAWMLLHFARSGARHVLLPVALGLLVGGSVSNLIDRVRDGRVTDFIHVSHWPTFNLADSFIVVGVVLLLISLSRLERERASQSDAVD